MACSGRDKCIPATDSEFCTCQFTFSVQDAECNVSSCQLTNFNHSRSSCQSAMLKIVVTKRILQNIAFMPLRGLV